MWHCWRSPAFVSSDSSRIKTSWQRCCLSFTIHCGPKQPIHSLQNHNLSLRSDLYVYCTCFTLGCQVHEAADHVCLVLFCFSNINTRPGIIIIITFIIFITLANIYGSIQCLRHCPESFVWTIPNPGIKSQKQTGQEERIRTWESKHLNLWFPRC